MCQSGKLWRLNRPVGNVFKSKMWGSKDLFSNLDLFALVHCSFTDECDKEVFKKLEDMACYAGLFLATAECFSQGFFCFLDRNKSYYTVLDSCRPFSRNIDAE